MGLPSQKKFKVTGSGDATPSKANHSTIRLPKNFELFQAFNMDRDGPNKKKMDQNGSILFRSYNDLAWVAAAMGTPNMAAGKTPGRRNRLASNLFHKPSLRGPTPLKLPELSQTAAPTPAAPGTPSKALFDAFTPIRDTSAKPTRPALVRRPLGSPYQEPNSRRVPASETRPAPLSRLGKEQEIAEDEKAKPKRKMASTAQKKLRTSVRLQNKDKLREVVESDKENQADGTRAPITLPVPSKKSVL